MSDYSLPNINETLFTSGEYQYMSYIPNSTPLNLIDKYIKGYKKSAEISIEKIVEESYNNSLKDSLIFPIIFNYRQMIELLLKKYYLKFHVQPVKGDLNHKLVPLWDKVEDHFLKAYSNANPVNLRSKINATKKYLEEYDLIDENSFAFRYPFNRDNNFTATIISEKHIDVINLKKRMDELYNFLEYAIDYLEEQ